ncbi:MAG: polymer-forming cytoskeletal protein [Defluviitaleaceae bacterium]|nr:polymer-forming cytoskeletal protein [Defluviitaleaceae bacterium]
MFFFKKAATVSDLDSPGTVIGKGVYLEAARMTGRESVRVDGIFKGNIEIDGSLVLGDSGSVTGDIRATYFLVAGEVNGNIDCSTQLHFASSSKVMGDVQANSLVVDEGAQVSGRYIVRGDRFEPVALENKYNEPPKLLKGFDDDSENAKN